MRKNANVPDQLQKLSAEYMEESAFLGDAFKKENFRIKGLYENGEVKDMYDFSIIPKVPMEKGEQVISISVEYFY